MGKPRFKELRENYNKKNGDIMTDLSIAELARRLKTTDTVIKGFEYGKTKEYKISHIEKYCDYFGVSADYLLGLNDNETVDENVKMISKYTGLDEESLQVINDINTQTSPEHEQWIKTLNTIIHNPNILYVISDIISSKKISGVLEVSKTPDEEGLNNMEVIQNFNDENEYKLFSYSANGSMLRHTITDELLEAAYWKELESLINNLKEKRKDGDTNAKESTLQSKRNRQRNNAKRPKA